MLPGFLMYSVALLFVLHFTEKQRKASLKYTRNRLFAYDIISSYTMVHSLWIIPIATVVNFAIIPIALQKFTSLSLWDIFVVSAAWLFFQPIYGLMLVKLWDSAAYAIRNLRIWVYFILKKKLMDEMLELKRDII